MIDFALSAVALFLTCILIGFIIILVVLVSGYFAFARAFTRSVKPREVDPDTGMPRKATRMPRGKRARMTR